MKTIDYQIATITERYKLRSVVKFKNKIKVERADGFVVFLDRVKQNDPDREALIRLNNIRLTERPIRVMAAVGYWRGMQIARNYAQTHSKQDLPELQRIVTSVFKNAVMSKKV